LLRRPYLTFVAHPGRVCKNEAQHLVAPCGGGSFGRRAVRRRRRGEEEVQGRGGDHAHGASTPLQLVSRAAHDLSAARCSLTSRSAASRPVRRCLARGCVTRSADGDVPPRRVALQGASPWACTARLCPRRRRTSARFALARRAWATAASRCTSAPPSRAALLLALRGTDALCRVPRPAERSKGSIFHRVIPNFMVRTAGVALRRTPATVSARVAPACDSHAPMRAAAARRRLHQ